MTPAPVLAVEGLTKHYNKKEAVCNLNFSVRKNELIGLLGPNGAGKSTTLRMIAGSLAPSSGSVKICGYDITGQPDAAKSLLGYLPEVPPLYPQMTVKEYLAFAQGLKNKTIEKSLPPVDPKWMEGLVDYLELKKVMPVLIRNLSKGFRQRVGIAAAMACKPQLLLLDEPASGLDPRQIADLRSLLRRLSDTMAIIVSSHGIYDVAALCTRIIIMNEGRIAADGTIAELTRIKKDQNGELKNSGSGDTKSGGKTDISDDRDKIADDILLAGALEQVFISLTQPREE